MDISLYDPEWVSLMESLGQKPALPDDPEERKESFNRMLIAMSKGLPATDEGISTRNEKINEHVQVRIYTPFDTEGQRLPLLLFLHGGGWQAGNLDTEDHTCRTICSENECIVVSVDYRLAPEVKFPVPIDDSHAAYLWAIEHASSLNADPARFTICGGSAGGALAIAVTYRLVQSSTQPKPAGLVTLSPMSLHPDSCPKEYKAQHTAYEEYGGDIPVVSTKDAMGAFERLGATPPFIDWTWFPQAGGAKALEGFPPTYIINTDLECFRDDGGVLEIELKDAGVPVKRDILKGWPHYYWAFPVEHGGALFRDTLVRGINWIVDFSDFADSHV